MARQTTSNTAPVLEPDSAAIVHTGSIASVVDLDYVHNEAHKVYKPSLIVRLIYGLTFQAAFPYVANHDALEAARQRRIIVDLLTKFWFGHHLVAKVLDIKDTAGGGHDFVTRLVRGREPRHDRKTFDFMKQLDERFLAAGLPTWQVTPYNPHAITNFVQVADGSFRIIDLESSLVPFFHPFSAILRLARAGIFPSFDDIDVDRLRTFLSSRQGELRDRLGGEYPALLAAVDAYDVAARRWHASEPRLINRFLRWLTILGRRV